MSERKWLFLGGVFLGDQARFVARHSVGVIQNAADAFQKRMIDGLDSGIPGGITIVNLPFIGSFPLTFKRLFFGSAVHRVGVRSMAHTGGFVTLIGVKYFVRLMVATRELLKTSRERNRVVLIYSAHLPFIIAGLFAKTFSPSTTLCLILPDLPEFMSEKKGVFALLKSCESRLFYRLVRWFDYYVVLTEAMIERIGANPAKCVVVEGIAAYRGGAAESFGVDLSGKVAFLYSGTLDCRYGVRNLIDAFADLPEENLELWICGAGDSSEYVRNAARVDKRIRFFGQILPDEVRVLQLKANYLVNPREDFGEYTKYSFPSKIMEYFATGRPVIMHKLPGIPNEYDGLFLSPQSGGRSAMAECLRQAVRDYSRWRDVGIRARQFVLEFKNPKVQCAKIVTLINERE